MLITLTGMWVVNIRVKYFKATESPGQGTLSRIPVFVGPVPPPGGAPIFRGLGKSEAAAQTKAA